MSKACIAIRMWRGTAATLECLRKVEILHMGPTFVVHHPLVEYASGWVEQPYYTVSHLASGLALVTFIGQLTRATKVCDLANVLLGNLEFLTEDYGIYIRGATRQPTAAESLGMQFVRWVNTHHYLSYRAIKESRRRFDQGDLAGAIACLPIKKQRAVGGQSC